MDKVLFNKLYLDLHLLWLYHVVTDTEYQSLLDRLKQMRGDKNE